jgi:WD40 repeat protein
MNRLWRCLTILGAALFLACVGSLLIAIAYLQRSATEAAPVLPTQLISPDSLPDGSFLTIGSGRIQAVDYAPDGATLAAATSAGIILYDTVEFRPRLTIPIDDGVDNVLWSPDSRILAASVHLSLVLYDAATGQELWRMTESQPAVVGQEMAWSPDGRYIASRALLMYQAHVWIWDAQSGERVAELRNRRRFPYAEGLAWSPDSRNLAVSYWYGGTKPIGGEPDDLYIWEVSDDPQVVHQWPLPEIAVGALEWTPDGRYIIAGNQSRVHVLDAGNGRALAATTVSMSAGNTIALSPDGKQVAVGGSGELVTLYQIPNLTRVDEIGVPNSDAESIAWSPDGSALAVSSSFTSEFFVWSMVNDALLAHVSTGANWVQNLAWSPDSERLAAIAQDSRTRVYAADTGALIFTVGEREPKWRPILAWSPDGRMLATTSGHEEEIITYTTSVWSDSGALLATIPGTLGAWSASDSLLTIMIDGGLQRWNLSAEEPRLVDEKPLLDLAYYSSPTDGFYAQKRRARDAAERWYFWESIVIRRAEDGGQVVELSDPGMSYIRSLAWSPDGQWLAASYDIDAEAGNYSHSKLAVWSATTWQVVRSFDNLSGSSWTLSWSPDSQWIAATVAPSASNLTLYPLSDS